MAEAEENDISHNDPQNADELPIKASVTQLLWDCVKIGENSVKKFKIINCSQNPLSIQVITSSMQFMLLGEQNNHDLHSTIEMSLQPLQTHMIKVNFRPSGLAAFVGVLVFTLTDPQPQQQTMPKQIYMYGYGGHPCVYIYYDNILSATDTVTGRMTLELGTLRNNPSLLTKRIEFQNSGDLSAFVYVVFEQRSMPFRVSVTMLGRRLVIRPRAQRFLYVRYKPRRQHFTYFRDNSTDSVFPFGMLKLYLGAEPLRGRLRRLASEGERIGYEVKDILKKICRVFRYEHLPEDVVRLQDDVLECHQLLGKVTSKRIVLTVKCETNHEE